MKNKWLIAVLAGAMFISCEGSSVKEADVPAAVVATFKTKYPTATDTKWKTEKTDGKDVYEAMFKVNGEEVEAEFLPDGTFYKEE